MAPSDVTAGGGHNLIGKVIGGRYEVDGRLGKGGMAVVYRARDKNLGRIVAIKVLRTDVAKDPVAAKRLVREARAAGQLHHPNIITMHDVGDSDGMVYIAMELLQGQELSEVMEAQGAIGLVRSLDIARQVAGALAVAHAHGIIHRDIKPENLFLCDSSGSGDYVKVLDFSIAKLPTNMVTAALTRAGSVFGTPHYMAPEQVEGRDVSPQTDIYALGAVLYESITGEPPFDGDSVIDILLQHVRGTPPRLDAGGRRLPAGLADLVESMLAKKASDRPTSAAEVERLLEQSLEQARAIEGEGANADLGDATFKLDDSIIKAVAAAAAAAEGRVPAPQGLAPAAPAIAPPASSAPAFASPTSAPPTSAPPTSASSASASSASASSASASSASGVSTSVPSASAPSASAPAASGPHVATGAVGATEPTPVSAAGGGAVGSTRAKPALPQSAPAAGGRGRFDGPDDLPLDLPADEAAASVAEAMGSRTIMGHGLADKVRAETARIEAARRAAERTSDGPGPRPATPADERVTVTSFDAEPSIAPPPSGRAPVRHGASEPLVRAPTAVRAAGTASEGHEPSRRGLTRHPKSAASAAPAHVSQVAKTVVAGVPAPPADEASEGEVRAAGAETLVVSRDQQAQLAAMVAERDGSGGVPATQRSKLPVIIIVVAVVVLLVGALVAYQLVTG